MLTNMLILKALTLAALAVMPVSGALKYKGVDWSSVVVEEKAGRSYKTTNDQTKPLEVILKESGVNTVRQRIWVNPADGNYNLAYNLQIAKRAKAAGLDIYLDLHYSDTWADPAHQKIPAGWPTDIENLSWKLYNYTLDVSNQFATAEITPSIISIGNEIRGGFLWPTGRYDQLNNIARLLNSAAFGIKDSKLSPKPKIMIHLDNGWDWGTQEWFYSSVLSEGPLSISDFDMMGVSFYPFYGSSATLANLKSSLSNMAQKWNKELVVAETNWPNSCPSPAYPFPSDLRDIPISATGQTTFMQKVAAIVAGVKNGNGIFYWEPAWVDNQGLGSSCSSNTMFSYPGTELSSLDVFTSI
ncbi:glycoside hydrolase family 53 protein [Astrocystis sublimbata]|nr:glycoside hydrolase family 53 protein [Astrocystis sublimbata]